MSVITFKPNDHTFLSTPSARRATRRSISYSIFCGRFLSTPSARRATRPSRLRRATGAYFYPRPPRGGRPQTKLDIAKQAQFLSTPSARRATVRIRQVKVSSTDFYPRPPRGGRPKFKYPKQPDLEISIHALREEGDVLPVVGSLPADDISIHALREEGDRCAPVLSRELAHISIHALREEGDLSNRLWLGRLFISIHALREEGDARNLDAPEQHIISIHALREEGDPAVVILAVCGAKFLSTPSARRATPELQPKRRRPSYFYPRPPRGGRLVPLDAQPVYLLFLSTPSARRATMGDRAYIKFVIFLSTPSARRATRRSERTAHRAGNFYPRPPRGGRPCRDQYDELQRLFLSTPSARRATRSGCPGKRDAVQFLSTPSARRATISRPAPHGT